MDPHQKILSMNIQAQFSNHHFILSNHYSCLADDDTNEDECFSCQRPGQLQCCDVCPKSFHAGCSLMKKNDQNLWQCQYCYKQVTQCQFCKAKIVEDCVKIRCTICFSPAHEQCLSRHRYNYQRHSMFNLPLQAYTYTCKKCLNTHGVNSIDLTFRRKHTSNHFDIFQTIQCLVRLNTRSPIHFGFYDDLSVNSSLQAAKKKGKGDKLLKIRTLMRKLQMKLKQEIKIQKLIAIKIPFQHKNASLLQIYNLLSDEQRVKGLEFGNRDNFYFYVKWENEQYQNCTWESQIVVQKLSQNKDLIFYFLKSQQIHHFLPLKVHNNQVEKEQKHKHYEQVEKQSRNVSKLCKYQAIYRIQLIDYQDERLNKQLSIYLNQIYLVQKQASSTIIVLNNDQIMSWHSFLKKVCPTLNILCFDSSQHSIDIILKRQYAYPNDGRRKFHVLLLTYEKLLKYSSDIIKKGHKNAIILFHDFSHLQFFHQIKANKKELLSSAKKFMFTLNSAKCDDKLKNKLIQYISASFKHSFLIRHKLSQAKTHIIQPFSKDYKEDKSANKSNQILKYCKKYALKESKQIVLLRYLMKFGILTNDIQHFYSLLHQFQPETYDVQRLVPWQKDIFSGYITSFLTLLSVSQDIEISPQLKKEYFFSIEPAFLLQRLIRLNCLNEKVKKGISFNVSPLRVKTSPQDNSQQRQLASWNIEDDKTLARLILKHGFGSIKQICSDLMWKAQKQTQKYTFGNHLKFKCLMQLKLKQPNIESTIKNRSIELLMSQCQSLLDYDQ